MTQLVIIGIGSPFHDDRLGWEVIQLLQQQPSLQRYSVQQLQILCVDRPGFHLLELMHDAEMVFLIDAVQSSSVPGTIHCFEQGDLQAMSSGYSSHALGVAEVITLGEVLNRLPRRVVLYGIEVGEQAFQFTPSPMITKAIRELVQQLLVTIVDHIRLFA